MALEKVYTTREVAEIEKVHSTTVSEACKDGLYPGAYRARGKTGDWRIPESAIVAHRQALVQRPAPEGGIEPYSPRAQGRKRRIA